MRRFNTFSKGEVYLMDSHDEPPWKNPIARFFLIFDTAGERENARMILLKVAFGLQFQPAKTVKVNVLMSIISPKIRFASGIIFGVMFLFYSPTRLFFIGDFRTATILS